jgi:hypothetical protein
MESLKTILKSQHGIQKKSIYGFDNNTDFLGCLFTRSGNARKCGRKSGNS